MVGDRRYYYCRGVEEQGKPPISVVRPLARDSLLAPRFSGGTMKVSDSVKLRVAVLLLVLLFLHVGNSAVMGELSIRQEYDERIADLVSERDAMGDEVVRVEGLLEEAEELYREKLMSIAIELYSRDYYSMGGYATPEGESLSAIYETIMNEVRDYRTLLLNLENYFDARQEYVDSVPSVWPIGYSEFTRVTSGFGWRISPITKTPVYHTGIDLVGQWNARVIATADGVVEAHYPPPGMYGGVQFRGHDSLGGKVKIEHEGGITTVYGHMQKTFVATGQEVSRGDVIGIMGNTGRSTGIHLHYEIHVDGVPVDPVGFLRF